MLGSPRTRSDFKLLESNIQKWKDCKVSIFFERIFLFESDYQNSTNVEIIHVQAACPAK